MTPQIDSNDILLRFVLTLLASALINFSRGRREACEIEWQAVLDESLPPPFAPKSPSKPECCKLIETFAVK